MSSVATKPVPPFFRAFAQSLPASGLERAGLACCLLIPWLLIVSRGGSDAAASVLGALFLWHSWREKCWGWTKDAFMRAGALCWGWMLLASLFAVDAAASFSVALPWGRWLLLYGALVFWLLRRPELQRIAALNIGLMLCLVIADTLWQYYTGISFTGNVPNENYRLTGPLDNVKVGLFISKLAFPACAVLLFMAMHGGRPARAWAVAALLGISILTVMLSGERTAFVSCLMVLGIVSLIIGIAEPAMRLRAFLAMAAVLAAAFLLLVTQTALQDRLSWLYANISQFSQSSYGQLDWVGWQLGKEHWATGAGLKGFRVLCLDFLESGQVTHCNLHPHNIYIEWLAELGMTGLALFALLVAMLCRKAWALMRAQSGPGRVLASFVLGIIAMHFFPLMVTQSFFSNWPALLLWYSISLAMAALDMVKSGKVVNSVA